MGRQPQPPPAKLVSLLIVSAVGLGLVAVGVTTTAGWKLLAPGFIALLVCLPWIWTIQKRRDRTLR
jgi:CHASE2 domain-containing sensor protein